MAAAAASVTTGPSGTPRTSNLTRVVGDDPAPEPGRGARDVDQTGGDEAAGERFGHPEGQAPRSQQAGHGHFHGLVVDAEDDVAQRGLDGPATSTSSLSSRAVDLASVRARAVMRDLDALDARGEEGQGDVAAARFEHVDAPLERLGQARTRWRPTSAAPGRR